MPHGSRCYSDCKYLNKSGQSKIIKLKSACQFYHFEVFKGSIVYNKAHHRTYFMETGNTCRSRIDMEHIQCFVILHL